MESIVMRLMNPALIWVVIPIVWISFSSIVELVKLYQRHAERMALIRQGIHPDLQEVETPDNSSVESDDPSGHQLRETTGYTS